MMVIMMVMIMMAMVMVKANYENPRTVSQLAACAPRLSKATQYIHVIYIVYNEYNIYSGIPAYRIQWQYNVLTKKVHSCWLFGGCSKKTINWAFGRSVSCLMSGR